MQKKRFKFRPDVFLLLSLLLISSGMLAFSSKSFIGNLKKISFSFVSETERAMYTVSSFVGESFSAMKELADLKNKYNELKKTVIDYELLQRSNADIMRENEHLRELLGFSQNITLKNIPAEIIGFDTHQLYEGIVINRGINQGVKKNMPVVAFQNNNMGLVGKIFEVGRNTSLVIPIYDYQYFVAGKLEVSGYRGLVGGNGSSELPLIMKHVTKRAESSIKIGDKIITSGFDDSSLVPKNITIGYISQIIVRDYETSLEIQLTPFIDFSKISHVFILDQSENIQEANQ